MNAGRVWISPRLAATCFEKRTLTNSPRAAAVRACGVGFADFDLEAFFDFEALPVELAMAVPPYLPGLDVTALTAI